MENHRIRSRFFRKHPATRVVFPDRARFNFGFSKFIVHFAAGGVWYKIPVGGVHEANKFRVNFPPESLQLLYQNTNNIFNRTYNILNQILVCTSTPAEYIWYSHTQPTLYSVQVIVLIFIAIVLSGYSCCILVTTAVYLYYLVHTRPVLSIDLITYMHVHTLRNLNHGHHNNSTAPPEFNQFCTKFCTSTAALSG